MCILTPLPQFQSKSDMSLLRGSADFRGFFPCHSRIDDSFTRITVFLWNFFTLTSSSRVILQVLCNYFFISEVKTFGQLYQIIKIVELRV